MRGVAAGKAAREKTAECVKRAASYTGRKGEGDVFISAVRFSFVFRLPTGGC